MSLITYNKKIKDNRGILFHTIRPFIEVEGKIEGVIFYSKLYGHFTRYGYGIIKFILKKYLR